MVSTLAMQTIEPTINDHLEGATYKTIAKALNYLAEHSAQRPALVDVARESSMSPDHFQRVFSAWAGLSPKQFLLALSAKRARIDLAHQVTLAEAADAAGLTGTGRLHDLFCKIEGMAPGQYKRGGVNMVLNYQVAEGKLGTFVVADTALGINHVHYLDDDTHALTWLQARLPAATYLNEPTPAIQYVVDYLRYGIAIPGTLALHLRGTPFQIQIWEALLAIPPGRLTSYGALAAHLGQHGASRAVGSAVGANPIAQLIPCHRVIQSLGGLGGYRWGLGRKAALIVAEMEQAT